MNRMMRALAAALLAAAVPFARSEGLAWRPGAKTESTISVQSPEIDRIGDNLYPGVSSANVGLWVPADFDPARDWNILLVSVTSDGGTSVGAMDSFIESARSAGGWIVMAVDGIPAPDDPYAHTFAYRCGIFNAAFRELETQWPAARNWGIATGGFSGGAKWSGRIGRFLLVNGYPLIGMWMGGCNEDLASGSNGLTDEQVETLRNVPIFLSAGDSDTVASVYSAQYVYDSMKNYGFLFVRLETYQGGHWLYPAHATEGLRWFRDMDGRGRTMASLDSQGGRGGTMKVQVSRGQAMPDIEPPSREGYSFQGYFSGTGGSGTQYYSPVGTALRPWDREGNGRLYACWTPNTYTIHLDRQGGTGGTDSIQVMFTAALPSIEAPTYAGRRFSGYFSEKFGYGKQYFDAQGNGCGNWDVGSETTLYAYWEGLEETVWSYSIENGRATLERASPAVGSLVVPAQFEGCPVVAIKEMAFYGCSELVSIALPDRLESIGSSAFYRCTGLESVTLPDSLRRIEDGAFSSCTGLQSVDLGGGLTSIGHSAFYYCNHLKSITIPDSVTSLGARAFGYCGGLETVVIGKGVTRIADNAFDHCGGMTSLTIGNAVTSIGGEAFQGCGGLTSISIPDSVTSLGWGAFCACGGLTSVAIPDSVTSLGGSAFRWCGNLETVKVGNGVGRLDYYEFAECPKLSAVELGSGVSKVGYQAFYECDDLVSFSVSGNNPHFSTANGLLLSKDGSTVVIGVNGDVVIPDGVRIIGREAFWSREGLVSIVFPDGLTRIGDSAFVNCHALKAVAIPGSVIRLDDEAFSCSGIASITIGNGVTSIGDRAFYWSSLEEATLSDSPGKIGTDAFSNCQNLKTLTVPSSWKGSSMLEDASVPEGCLIVYADSTIVYFDSNGGECETGAACYRAEEPYCWLPTPTRSGCSFDGWYASPYGGRPIDVDDEVDFAEWRNLYAMWVAWDSIRTPVVGRFDGDERDDIGIFGDGVWRIEESDLGRSSTSFGSGDCIPVPADYDGDGTTDLSVYDTMTGDWWIRYSTGLNGRSWICDNFGSLTCKPYPADYDGDGIADLSVWDGRTGDWFIRFSTGGWKKDNFGSLSCIPVPADYDGDGKADLSVRDNATGDWWIRYTRGLNGRSWLGDNFGSTVCDPYPADYDGDGLADLSVYDQQTGDWFVRFSSGGWTKDNFGMKTCIPVPADYDGDGLADFAVYDTVTSTFWVRYSGGGWTSVSF